MSKGQIKLLYLFLTGFLIFSLISCRGDEVSSSEATTKGEGASKSTLMVYIAGGDLEYKYGAASKNIRELLENETDEYNNIIIEVGATKKWRGFDFDTNRISRYIIKNHELKLLERVDNSSMGDSKTLESFIDFSLSNYKGDRNSLVLWNHGGGINGGICYDELYEYDSLTIDELKEALEVVKKYTPRLNLLAFDACLMSGYELMEGLIPYSDYLIGSAEIEPVLGLSYTNILNNTKSDSELYNILLDYKVKCILNKTRNYTLSLIDLNKANKIVEEFNGFTHALKSIPLSTIIREAIRSFSYGDSYFKKQSLSLIDLYELSNNLFYHPLANQIKANVKKVSSDNRGGGLSIYFPENYNREDLDKYLALPINKGYRELLKYKYDNIKEVPISFLDKGHIDNNSLTISLSEDSMHYVADIEYKLYKKNNDSYIPLGYDSDIHSNKNIHSVLPNGRWISWNGNVMNLIIEERDLNVIYYNSPIIKNETLGYLRLAYDNITHEITILGFVPMYSNKYLSRTEKLNPGDEITIIYSNMGSDNIIRGKSFSYSFGSKPEIGDLDNGEYMIYIEVMDIFNKLYKSNSLGFKVNDNEIIINKNVDLDFSNIN